LRSWPTLLACLALFTAVLLHGAEAAAQCVDEELKQELVGKRAYRGVVPRQFKKALRHELSPLGGWDAQDLADGAPVYGGAYTFHFTEELGLEASYLHTRRVFGLIDAVNRRNNGIIDIGNAPSDVNMFMGHLVWTLAYGKVRWFGGPIGRFDFMLAAGAGAVDEAGSRGVAGSFGIGMKFFLLDWLGLRFDMRDMIRSIEDPLGGAETVNDVLFLGGLSVFIPFSS
jgi:outer membrane beta-barrel protein